MTIEYTGRQTTIYPKLKTMAEVGLARIDKVTNRCTHAHVILSEDKYRKIAEVTIQCRGESIVARCQSTSMEASLHDALVKVEQQAIRHKERYTTVRDHSVRPDAVQAL